MTLTASEVARWAYGVNFDEIPPAARQVARSGILDAISVSLSGSRLDATRIVTQVALTGNADEKSASLLGQGRRASLMDAALINGTAAHAELFDDNSQPMISHPSSPLVSALLPLGQVRRKSGREVLTAYACGFEVSVGLGRALNPGLYEKGWHVTRSLGLLGTTVACAKLLGLGVDQTVAALGIASSMASGLRQNFGTMTMALHVGLTARDAVHAALLAEAGLLSDPQSLEGKYGYFQCFSGQQPRAVLLGQPWELLASGLIFKPYPSGAPTHAAVEAAIDIHRALHGAVDDIASVRCRVHPWNAMTLRDEPVRDTLQARVSMRYCLAAGLRYGELTSQQFEPACLADAQMQRLMSVVTIDVDDSLPDNGLFPSEVQVQTKSGQVCSVRREIPPGAPQRGWSLEEAQNKFRICGQGILSTQALDQSWALGMALEHCEEISELCVNLQGDRPTKFGRLP